MAKPAIWPIEPGHFTPQDDAPALGGKSKRARRVEPPLSPSALCSFLGQLFRPPDRRFGCCPRFTGSGLGLVGFTPEAGRRLLRRSNLGLALPFPLPLGRRLLAS